MTIGRVAPLEPIQNNGVGRLGSASKAVLGDSVQISTEAKEKAEWLQTMEIVSSAPDVRADRIAELKAKINDPAYINDTILRGTADKIIDMLIG